MIALHPLAVNVPAVPPAAFDRGNHVAPSFEPSMVAVAPPHVPDAVKVRSAHCDHSIGAPSALAVVSAHVRSTTSSEPSPIFASVGFTVAIVFP